MKSFGPILLLAASCVNTAYGISNLFTGWEQKFDNEPYEDLTAQVGDTITFIWVATQIHNIFIHPTNDCTQTGRIAIGNETPTTYTFKPEDGAVGGKSIFFSNDVTDMCENYGMRLTVIVYPADEDGGGVPNVNLTPEPIPTNTPTVTPTLNPTPWPTRKPTDIPTIGPVEASTALRSLQMTLSGIDSFSEKSKEEWSTETAAYCTSFYENDVDESTFETNITVTNFFVTSNSKRSMRGLQTGDVIITYNQVVSYSNIGNTDITDEYLAKAPFANRDQIDSYVTVLQESDDVVLKAVTNASPVTFANELVPTGAPADNIQPQPNVKDGEPSLSLPAIIGIACGGGALIIIAILFWIYCRATKSKELERDSNVPLPNVSIKPDDVSTLAAPETSGNFGDRSLGTVDYDYSKAYQDKDHSISFAGGTLGSDTQDFSFPQNAGATGAALGPYDDDGPFGHNGGGKFKDEILHIYAPAGKLGVVIDTPDDGAPLVHAVKETSVVVDKVKVGDKLVAVDDEDVRTLTAIKVSKLISRKSANPSRKLTVLRRTKIG